MVRTPRSDDPVSGNRLRECLQNFESLEKEIQCTKVCEDASFSKRFSIVMCYETVADVDGWVFEIEIQHAGIIHTFVRSQIQEFMPQSQVEQQLDQFFE